MTKDELLKPRYKVIGICPHSKLKAGDILYLFDFKGNQWFLKTEFDKDGLPAQDISHYPHLFQPLQWWEDRRPEDMPEYVKWGKQVLKVDEWIYGSHLPHGYWASIDGYSNYARHFIPATQSEYEQFKTK